MYDCSESRSMHSGASELFAFSAVIAADEPLVELSWICRYVVDEEDVSLMSSLTPLVRLEPFICMIG